MMPPTLQVPHPARIAGENRAYAVFLAKVDHLAGAFVAQFPDAPLGPGRTFTPRAAQFAVATGPLFATGAFTGQLRKLLG
jgi:hypothetical protein